MFAALVTSLVMIGLVRFAYTPLLPALIREKWFPATDLVYLSAASLLGYLVGALCGRPLAARFSNIFMLRTMNILASLSLAACAFPLSLSWFFIWRLLAGISGGIVLVLVAATVLPHFPMEKRGMVSGVIFLGLGLGITVSGTLLPFLLHYGLRVTWMGIALLASILSVVSWSMWPPSQSPL